MSNEPSPRAEFWQLLARAFAVPRGVRFFSALRSDLASDLDDLANELELHLGRTPCEFFRAARNMPDAQALLVAYSRLFLTPPIPCRLTLGWHLDGTLMGPSERYLCDLMANHGIAQTEIAGDSPDALPTVLEFIALLFQRLDTSQDASLREGLEKDIGILRTHYLGHTIGRMVDLAEQGEDEYELAPVYSALLKIIDAALDDPRERFFVRLPKEAVKARPRYFAKRGNSADQVCCKVCGKPIATARELGLIVRRLERSGLPADHLTLCPNCRGAEMGWKAQPLNLGIVAPA